MKVEAKADDTTDKKLVLAAMSAARGMSVKIRPIRIYNGEPGGCGMPRI